MENLSSRVSWQDLKDFMRQAGEVSYADAHKNFRNEGCVEFATRDGLLKALDELDNMELHGRRIRVVEAGKRETRRRRSRSPRSRSPLRRRSRSPRSPPPPPPPPRNHDHDRSPASASPTRSLDERDNGNGRRNGRHSSEGEEED